MNRTVHCPTCRRPVQWTPENTWRPFCSERCKLIDLGAWASEERYIAGPDQPQRPDGSDRPQEHD